MKAILLPLAFKAMAVMSTIAVMMSTMSLIISSIIGYAKLAWQHVHPAALRVLHLGKGNSWAKEDDLIKNYPFAEVIHYNEGEEEELGVTPLHHVHYYHK
nr:unnamed protein product [Callosobruchus analis]